MHTVGVWNKSGLNDVLQDGLTIVFYFSSSKGGFSLRALGKKSRRYRSGDICEAGQKGLSLGSSERGSQTIEEIRSRSS